MSAAVEIDTKVLIKDVVHGQITVESVADDGEGLNILQDNDQIYTTKASAVVLAKVILQRYGLSFEAVVQQEVDYSA